MVHWRRGFAGAQVPAAHRHGMAGLGRMSWTLRALVLSALAAQPAAALTGKVVNAETQAPLAGAAVTLGTQVVSTGDDGSFDVSGEGARLLVRAPGFGRMDLPVDGFGEGAAPIALKPIQVRALYLSVYGIASSKLREGALDLIRQGRANALVIDVKDDRSQIPFKIGLPMAAEIGAQRLITIRNIKELLSGLHDQGIYTIGRIVVFKDDKLAAAHPEWTVRTKGGGQFRDRERLRWMNPFRQQVWEYNIAIAKEAAEAGFDEVQFDYVRFPDGRNGVFSQPATVETNRLHPDGRGQVRGLRSRVSQLAAAALARPMAQGRGIRAAPAPAAVLAPVPVAALTPVPDAMPGSRPPADVLITASARAIVQNGIDVLESTGFAPLAGLRVGLITNQTGLDANGRRTADVLASAPGMRLVRLFSPEHGLSGTLDEKVGSSTDAATGLQVFSLYGDVRRPTADALAGLDALVFDIQDVGSRYYTYITTLAYAMEAAAKSGLKVVVLDRPNPLNADTVQGPVMEAGLRSFAGYFPLPTRHGMTVGEIAQLCNREAGIGADLRVIAMEGYRRRQWFDQTGHPWVNPSPNLRSLTEAILYAGVGMLEGTNVSVGRGTATPFEVLGAPWMDGPGLAGYLTARGIPGVRIRAASFTPVSGPYRGVLCQGVRFEVSDRDLLDPPRLGVELISALWRLHRGTFQGDRAAGMVGSRTVVQSILDGSDPAAVRSAWQPELDRFIAKRWGYLLYQ